MVKFEWDLAKAASNKRKHGVTFEEAESVFYDDFAIQFFDEENSQSATVKKSLVSSFESYQLAKQLLKSVSSTKVNDYEK